MSAKPIDVVPLGQGEPATILIIEDNIDDQNLLKRQLTKAGVQERVVCLSDGSLALNLIREGSIKLSCFSVIFLDLSLPGANGLLLLHAIRTNAETRLMPVFVVTGSMDPKVEAEAKRLGATSFIPKDNLALPSFRSTISEIFSLPR